MSDSTISKLDKILARQREKLEAEQVRKQQEADQKAAADKVRGEGREAWNNVRVFVNEEVAALNEKMSSEGVFLRKEYKGSPGSDKAEASVVIKVEAVLAKDHSLKMELLQSGRIRVTVPPGWNQNSTVMSPGDVTRDYVAQALMDLLDKSI